MTVAAGQHRHSNLLNISIHWSFGEYLTESAIPGNDIVQGGRSDARGGGLVMEYEDTSAKKTQLMAMLMTVAIVGGVIAYVM